MNYDPLPQRVRRKHRRSEQHRDDKEKEEEEEKKKINIPPVVDYNSSNRGRSRERDGDHDHDHIHDHDAALPATSDSTRIQHPVLGLSVDTWSFEYLDHSADVQIHSWGSDLETALANQALGMFNYMTPLEEMYAIAENEGEDKRRGQSEPQLQSTASLAAYSVKELSMTGHDLHSLTYNFLDELLFVFSTEMYVVCAIQVLELDVKDWSIRVRTWGCTFDERKHSKGTEVKAITYSAMQVLQSGRLDRDGNAVDRAEVYVIVDI